MRWVYRFINCIAEFQQRRADLYLQHLSSQYTKEKSQTKK
jgi:hypothetical protein